MSTIARQILILAYICMGLPSLGMASNCLNSKISPGESKSTVNLLTKVSEPYFYYRSLDYNFAILVSPNIMLGALESPTSSVNKEAERLLELVKKDLPLTVDTDLFRYVLQDYYRLSLVQRTLVEVMARGNVALFDARTGELIPRIELRSDNSARGRSRAFYAPKKALVLYSLDCVEN